MLKWIKKKIYFAVAHYFRYFAKIQLAFWRPKIIVVTGSSGKTTLLHLIEAQLGDRAKYSHHANSTFGIPFDILGFKRPNLTLNEWPYLFLAAPFRAFKKTYAQKLYIVETDCERPNEGRFLATLLKPEVTLWLNTGRTHSHNFDRLISQKRFLSVEEAIAYEFGFYLEYTKTFSVLNGDQTLIIDQHKRSKARTKIISRNSLNDYRISADRTEFKINNAYYQVGGLLPEEAFYSIAFTKELVDYLSLPFDPFFSKFALPPGRCSIFSGIKNITIIDSSYNATPEGMAAILKLFNLYPAQNKWLILGDMIELGDEEKEEHEKLALAVASTTSAKIILVGSRILKYTYPKLTSYIDSHKIVKFEYPRPALDYILSHIEGGETLLFKGARFLEGMIEHLLLNKVDIAKLCRRETIWQRRRKNWGL